MSRERLPNRRHGESFAIEHVGSRFRMQVNEYPDGRLGEVFLNADLTDSAIDAVGADYAVLLSLLLQYGMKPAEIAHALGRNTRGEPQTIAGTVADFLVKLDVAAVMEAAE